MLRVQDFCKPYSTPNQKKAYNELSKRLIKYVGMVRAIYDALNLEASKLAIRTGYDSSMDVPFRFSDYPQTQKAIQELQALFVTQLGTMITSAMSEEWKRSNTFADMLADKVLKSYGAHKRDKYYRVNNEALQAFQRRRDSGMNLSQKLWNQSEDYKRGLEHTLSVAIEKGMSAVALSKRVSKYLLDFDSLRKDYGSRFGRATDIHDCEYRSVRLARSEINMAYRNAEQLRWSQMDFIIGYEVKLSGNHNCKGVPQGAFYDICDELKGRYPKNFKWLGWHPNCRCYVVPIIKSEDRFWEDEDKRGNDNEEITDVPQQFKNWVESNIQRAKSWGHTPYFIRDNSDYIREDFKIGVYDEEEKSFVRKGRTKLAMSRVEFYQSIYPQTPETRLAAINAYTQAITKEKRNKGATFREINKRLRNENTTEYVDVASDLISKGLKDLPIYELPVYRGTHLSKKQFEKFYLSHMGEVIVEKSFTSTSMFKEAPLQFLSYEGVPKSHVKVLFEIHGKKGRDISKISEFNGIFAEQNQFEVLFDKGSRFHVSPQIKEIDGIVYLKLIEA